MSFSILSRNNVNKKELIKAINRALFENGMETKVTEENFDLFSKAFAIHRTDHDVIGKKIAMPEMPKSPNGEVILHHLVPHTYFHINAKTTTLVAAATALDMWFTAGAANVLLGLSGQTKQTLSRLSPEDGQYCNWCTGKRIIEESKKLTPKSVVSEIKNSPCCFQDLDCTWMDDNKICTINESAVEENFEILGEKGALNKQRGRWDIPF